MDGNAVVEGKFVQEDKYGSVQRQFLRKIALPKGIQIKDIRCEFSEDGTLRIIAKNKTSLSPSETSDSIAIIDAERTWMGFLIFNFS